MYLAAVLQPSDLTRTQATLGEHHDARTFVCCQTAGASMGRVQAISLRTGIFTAIPGIMAGPIFTALFYGSRELMESGYIVASVRLP